MADNARRIDRICDETWMKLCRLVKSFEYRSLFRTPISKRHEKSFRFLSTGINETEVFVPEEFGAPCTRAYDVIIIITMMILYKYSFQMKIGRRYPRTNASLREKFTRRPVVKSTRPYVHALANKHVAHDYR